MKAVIYVRVSFEDQVHGTSLDTQQANCIKYCKAHDIEVAKVFREAGVSAKSTQRPELMKAIAYCTKARNEVDAVVVYKVDRFARNAEDHFTIRRQLLSASVVLRSVTEPIGNDPSQKFMETLLAATAEFDNSIRAIRCTEGMSARINAGIWPWKAPLGYKMSPERQPGDKKRQPDVPDERTFPILQTAFREFARGLHTQKSFATRLDDLGLAVLREKPTTPQYAQLLLSEDRLRFYGGELFNPWTAEYIEAAHEPMLTRSETLELMVRLKFSKRPRVRVHLNDAFPLRGGTALCGACSRPYTASRSRGNGGHYHYYHCFNKACSRYGRSIPKHALEDAFVAKLKEISLTEKFSVTFREIFISEWKKRAGLAEEICRKSKDQLRRLKKRKNRIFDRFEEGLYTRDEFVERRKQLENDILAVTVNSNETHMDQMNYEESVDIALTFLADIATHWRRQPAHIQRQFQQLVFPEGIRYVPNEGFGTAKMAVIFELNRDFDGDKSKLVDQTVRHWNQIGSDVYVIRRLNMELTSACASNERMESHYGLKDAAK